MIMVQKITVSYPSLEANGLDSITENISGGQFIALAGRPGTGKTHLAILIAQAIARKEPGGSVVIFFWKQQKRCRNGGFLSWTIKSRSSMRFL